MMHVFEFLAGIGLFLFAMSIMESSLKDLSGRTFKLFLRKYTSNTAGAISSGALITGILQSSSVVILTVLAFVGAGIVTMRNALGVVIGSNFGTTLDSWLVATLGFKVEIDLLAFPVLGLAAIAMIFIDKERKLHQFLRFLLGFGFLFLGLGFMQDSMSEIFADFDFTKYEGYPRIAFVGIGFVLTTLIQSSSASIAIFLSALNTGAIPFETAVAAVIGSELGNAVKVVVGAVNGNAAKWQLAVGNTIFNVVVCSIAFIFMDSYMLLAAKIAGKDQLLQLVAFQSSINLVIVLLMAPFLNPFARLLEKYVKVSDGRASFVIGTELLKMPDVAADALEQDVELLLHRVLHLNLEAFATEKKVFHSPKAIEETLAERNKKLNNYEKKYEDLKKAEGEILIYALKLIEVRPGDHKRIDGIVSSVRHAMHSAKAMKDVHHNRIEFHESADDIKFRHYIDFRQQLEEFYSSIDRGLSAKGAHSFVGLIEKALEDYEERKNKIYNAALKEKLVAEDLSSLMNVNRELYTSCKTIVQALQLYHESNETGEIGEIP